MPTERQIQETVARCVSIMVYYHNPTGCAPRDEYDMMVAEVQVMAAWVQELGLMPVEIDERVLRPVEAELVNRFGHELGRRLGGQFLEAFDGLKVPEDGGRDGVLHPSDSLSIQAGESVRRRPRSAKSR